MLYKLQDSPLSTPGVYLCRVESRERPGELVRDLLPVDGGARNSLPGTLYPRTLVWYGMVAE